MTGLPFDDLLNHEPTNAFLPVNSFRPDPQQATSGSNMGVTEHSNINTSRRPLPSYSPSINTYPYNNNNNNNITNGFIPSPAPLPTPMPSNSVSSSSPTPSATSSTTKSNSLPTTRKHKEKELETHPPQAIKKRTLNTLAARRYRQRRVDQVTELEGQLKETRDERDALQNRVSRLEGELDVLRRMVGNGSGSAAKE